MADSSAGSSARSRKLSFNIQNENDSSKPALTSQLVKDDGLESTKTAVKSQLIKDDWKQDLVLNPKKTNKKIFNFFSMRRAFGTTVLAVAVIVCSFTIPDDTFPVSVTLTLKETDCLLKCEDSQKKKGDNDFVNARIRRARRQIGGEAASCDDIFRKNRCKIKYLVPVWHTITSVGLFVFCVFWCFLGSPPEIFLPGGAVMLAYLGIIRADEPFRGLADSGVITLAVLFPIASAIGETGLVEWLAHTFLGKPTTVVGALYRMLFTLLPVAAFLNNTALVAIMIPFLVNWSRSLGVHPGKFLMPLSFGCQMGACLTKIGSSCNLIAADVVKRRSRVLEKPYDLEMFDTLPSALVIAVITQAVMAPLAASNLLTSTHNPATTDKNTKEKNKSDEISIFEDMGDRDSYEIKQKPGALYRVLLTIHKDGPLRGKSLPSLALGRIPGVENVKLLEETDESGTADCYDNVDAHADVYNSGALKGGEVLEAWATGIGVHNLRFVDGLDLSTEPALSLLGASRRKRCLYEVVVRENSAFIKTPIFDYPGELRFLYGACLVAGPKQDLAEPLQEVTAGSVLLFEIDERWLSQEPSSQRWSDACSLVLRIPDTSPNRIGHDVDLVRRMAVGFGLVIVVILVSIPPLHLELHTCGVLLLGVYLIIRAIHPNQVLCSIRADILLVIVGAMAFGTAFCDTGVVHWLSRAIFQGSSSMLGTYAKLYLLAASLGLFINNSAVVAILGPLVVSLAEEDPDLYLPGLTWMLMLAAGSCFVTPLGYQTNLMVMPVGQYSFSDFAKFGIPIQLVHFAVSVLTVGLATIIFQ